MKSTGVKAVKKSCSCNFYEKAGFITRMSHASFVSFFDDLYTDALYDTELLIDSIVKQLNRCNAVKILDCAAGTGFPALRLRQHGYTIDCTDFDPEMIQKFKQNAHAMGVSEKIECLQWGELNKLKKKYDFIICRGNSLVYDGTWGGSYEVAQVDTIEQDLQSMARKLMPGGYLYIDITKTRRLEITQYPIGLDGVQYLITEEVTLCNNGRHWFVKIESSKETYAYDLWSSSFGLGLLQSTLQKIGFSDVDEVALPGERKNFAVIIARKSA